MRKSTSDLVTRLIVLLLLAGVLSQILVYVAVFAAAVILIWLLT